MDKIDICNMALIKVRQASIASLGDETLQAKNCLAFYEQSRRSVLSQYSWSFAIKTSQAHRAYTRADDASDNEKYVHRYKYEYQLPKDFLGLVEVFWKADPLIIHADSDHPEYVLEYGESLPEARVNPGRRIKTDYNPIIVKYIFNLEDVNQFSPLFTDCLVLDLAHRLGSVFLKDEAILRNIIAEYELAFSKAKRKDAQQTMLINRKLYPLLRANEGAL